MTCDTGEIRIMDNLKPGDTVLVEGREYRYWGLGKDGVARLESVMFEVSTGEAVGTQGVWEIKTSPPPRPPTRVERRAERRIRRRLKKPKGGRSTFLSEVSS